MLLSRFYVDDLIKRAVLEDIPYLDITTDLLIDENSRGSAVFIAKQDGVLCGIGVALRVFELTDDTAIIEKKKNDGDDIRKGELLATVEGSTSALLRGERTALNLLQHMSGVATMTRQAVRLVEGTGCMIADTRKTTPLLRPIEKYAVMTGGGKNHRFCLSDAAMIKDNHVDAVGSICQAVRVLKEKAGHTVKIEVEVRDFEELKQALDAGADIIMLDNMNVQQMREAVTIAGERAKLEASGGITLQSIGEVARCGVDIISLGALTHSCPALDISMKIK